MSDRVQVKAEMAASVWKVEVEPGQTVGVDDVLMILESMKMEIPVHAPCAGVVAEVLVVPEQSIGEGDVLVSIERQH